MADVKRGAGPFVKLALLVAIVVAGALLVRFTPAGQLLTRDGIAAALADLRGSVWAPLLFVALYATATALAIPGTILTLAGGALFGVFWGTVFNSIGANLGANLAFLEARFLGREGVERLAGDRLEKLDRATRDHGFRGLLVLRLVPLVPFNALNFGSGLTAISWPAYAAATLIGIFPGTVVYTNFADALLQGSQEASREALLRVLVSGVLLILLSLLPTVLKKMRVKIPGSAALLLLVLLAPTRAPAQDVPDRPTPAAEAQQRGTPAVGPTGQAAALPDHQTFTAVLQAHVRIPRVDYAGLQADRAGLDAYLERLAATDPAALAAAPRAARLAFWINAYNACMLRQVVDHYPIKRNERLWASLKNSVTRRPDNSVWQIDDVFTRTFCPVAGVERSQDEIEHDIIRPMGEPRIHFAVNCAARSCPPLLDRAYVPDELDRQLDAAVRRLVDNPGHFVLESGPNPLVRLNRVLEWYGEDFGGTGGLKRFLAGYLGPEAARLIQSEDTSVEYFDYDWTLNDVQR